MKSRIIIFFGLFATIILLFLNEIFNSIFLYNGDASIVDILMFYADKNVGADEGYVLNGDWWAAVKFMMQNNDVRVHIITDSQQILNNISSLGQPYFGYDLKYFQNMNETFFQIYKHVSVNTFTYEYLCFYRWFVFNEIVKLCAIHNSTHPIRKIITMDLDAIILTSPSTLFRNVLKFYKMNVYDLTNIMMIPGAVTLWSPKGLNQFTVFLRNCYDQSPQNFYVLANEFEVKFEGRLHISDINFLRRFSTLNSLRSRQINSNLPIIVGESPNECIAFRDRHFQEKHYIDKIFVDKSRKLMINLHNRTSQLCLVHFQGNLKSQMKRIINSLIQRI